MHQHLVAAYGGEQTDLRGADDRPRPDRDIARLHVVADATDEIAGTDRLVDLDAGAPAVGAVERQDRVRERGQRCAGVDTDGLARLQPDWLPRSGVDLPDDGKGQLGGFTVVAAHVPAGIGDVDAADRVTVDRGLVEARERAFGDDLLGAQQALRLRDCNPHRARRHGRCRHSRQLVLNRAHACLPVESPGSRATAVRADYSYWVSLGANPC